MRKVITATLIAAAALSTTAALAETASFEQRQALKALWGKSATPAVSAQASKQVSTTRDTSVSGAFDGVFFGVDKNSGSYKALRNLRSSQPHRADR
ncbi:MAG: hypothetical protein AAGH68_06195 [Pseudomonadota bacterium]